MGHVWPFTVRQEPANEVFANQGRRAIVASANENRIQRGRGRRSDTVYSGPAGKRLFLQMSPHALFSRWPSHAVDRGSCGAPGWGDRCTDQQYAASSHHSHGEFLGTSPARARDVVVLSPADHGNESPAPSFHEFAAQEQFAPPVVSIRRGFSSLGRDMFQRRAGEACSIDCCTP